ncbi:MAG: Superoxide dismutase [Sphingobacteriales bacterium]|nr:Superoxide dismutase [Sphingobacteriales bacterium]
MKNNSRRKFIQNAFKTAAVAVGAPAILSNSFAYAGTVSKLGLNEVPTIEPLKFAQIKLPYSYAALEPSIDALTMEIHYSKHHTAYIKNVNEALLAENISYTTEKELFSNASKLSAKIRNNGGGAWNHNFFWEIMKPGSKGPEGKVLEAINASFGSFDKFKEQFTQAGITRFGSGWAWLVNDNGTLKIGSTANQDNPLFDNAPIKGTPLLALDVWEHAYYLKYQNKRNEYIANWWNVVNWDAVAKKMS